jgi:hypothetical protein
MRKRLPRARSGPADLMLARVLPAPRHQTELSSTLLEPSTRRPLIARVEELLIQRHADEILQKGAFPLLGAHVVRCPCKFLSRLAIAAR